VDKTEIEKKVKNVIVDQLGVNPEQVTASANIAEDLGADSLDQVELIMALEEEFEIEITDEEAEKPEVATVGGIIDALEKRLAA
jgi:acyl carrier protein